MNSTIETIMKRRTTRKFRTEPVKRELLDQVIQAGLYAPSGHNMQSWHFTVIEDRKIINDLNVASKEQAKSFPDELIQKMANNENLDIFYGAPVLVLVSAQDNAMTPQADCGAATQNMLLAAESLDLGACWNGFTGFLFNSEKGEEYKSKLKLPKGFSPLYAVAIGHKDFKASGAPARRENTVTYL